jgi:hypothetical protein
MANLHTRLAQGLGMFVRLEQLLLPSILWLPTPLSKFFALSFSI